VTDSQNAILLRFAALLGLIFAASSSFAQEQSLLRSHWQPGKLYKQQTETQTTSTLTPAPGESVEQKLSVKQTTDIRVTPEPGTANKRAEVKFTAVTGEMNFMAKTYKFDSADPQAAHPLLRQALMGTAGKSFVVVFDGEDEFVDLKDTEKMASDGTTVTGLAAVADARAIGELFRQSLDVGLPKTPVALGDKWTTEQSLLFPQAGKMKVTLNSRYDEIVQREGRRHARVIFEGNIASEPAGAPGDRNKGEPVASLSGESRLSGQVFFDLERRTVSLSVFLANLTLNLSGNRIPLRQQVTTRLVSITDNP
jgi:Family of unknown function (DUF6263)